MEPCGLTQVDSRRAPDLYVRQTPEEQARLMRFVDSNSRWDGVTLTPIYRKPFDFLAEGLHFNSGGAETYPYTNFAGFTQTLERLSGRLLDDLYGELAIA